MHERIKKIRKVLNLTQQEFADRLGIKRGTMANYEIGRNEPIDAVISLMCKTFNVSEEWLRTGNGDMFLPSSTSELDQLAKKYNLSRRVCVLVERFLDLKPEIQEAMVDYALSVAETLAHDDLEQEPPAAVPGWKPMTAAEIEREVAAYREELELEARAADGSAVSPKRNGA